MFSEVFWIPHGNFGVSSRACVNTVPENKVSNIFHRVGHKRTVLVKACINDEFRSSRNIALSLHQRYKNVVERGFSRYLKDFITAGVTAYAVGCTDEGLRNELFKLQDSREYLIEKPVYKGNPTVKLELTTEEINECILWSTIVFITILCTPQPTVVRWSSASPVSDEALSKWKGFCSLIANAYYTRGMAWFPVKTLQLEQMAVMGHAEEPSLVADKMRLVFATLEEKESQSHSADLNEDLECEDGNAAKNDVDDTYDNPQNCIDELRLIFEVHEENVYKPDMTKIISLIYEKSLDEDAMNEDNCHVIEEEDESSCHLNEKSYELLLKETPCLSQATKNDSFYIM